MPGPEAPVTGGYVHARGTAVARPWDWSQAGKQCDLPGDESQTGKLTTLPGCDRKHRRVSFSGCVCLPGDDRPGGG